MDDNKNKTSEMIGGTMSGYGFAVPANNGRFFVFEKFEDGAGVNRSLFVFDQESERDRAADTATEGAVRCQPGRSRKHRRTMRASPCDVLLLATASC
jgi:hypothetical protein